MVDGVFADIKLAFRAFLRNPGFTLAAVCALALGIGANTAVFSIVSTVLLRPLPYREPDRIVVFTRSSPEDSGIYPASPVKFNFWQEQNRAFQDVSAYRYSRVNMMADDHVEQIQAAIVSANYFRLFGQRIERGRVFAAGEDRPNAIGVAVISDPFWRRAFGGDTRTIGRTLSVSGSPYEVIGIMAGGAETEPPGTFDTSSVQDPIDVWIPFQIAPGSSDRNGYFNVAARLKPKVSLAAAAAEMQLLTQEFRRRFPGELPPSVAFSVQEMREALVGRERTSLFIFSGAVLFVLLIACANVANLLLIRGAGRKREIAIRATMGAGRQRIVRQLLTESLVLSTAGGLIGVVLGIVGIRALLRLDAVNIPRIGHQAAAVAADWRVLCFTLLTSLITGILFGLVPALQVSRADLSGALKEGSGQSGTGYRQNRVRSVLVVSEVTLAVVLLVGAGLLIRSFLALRSVNPGFDSHHVLTMEASLTAARFQKTAAVAELVRDSVQRISALPGVDFVATTCCLPLENTTIGDVVIAGRPLNGKSHGSANITTISPRYFDALRIPVLHGRAFTERDGREGEPVVVISEAMARRYWPNDGTIGDPLTASLTFIDLPGHLFHIVGVVGDVHANGLSQNSPAIVYFSFAQAPDDLTAYVVRSPIAWIVRSRDQSRSLRAAIQKELTEAGSGLPVSRIRSMDEVLSESIAGREFNTVLLGTFSGSALLLAAIGIYGLIAFSVRQRRQEIGIRLALGAQSSYLRNMVVFQGMRLALTGIGLGLIGAFGLTRLIAGFVFGVQVHDPLVFLAVPVLLSAVAFAAVWLPARDASRIDPIEALRYE